MDLDDEGPARGWDLFRWKWAREPNETFAAVVYWALFLVMATLFGVGVLGLVQFLAPIWSGNAPGATEPGAPRDRLIAIGALLTTPFLVWRVVVAHWAARASQEQARIAQETSRNTLFTKAVEQLGAMRDERVKEETRDAEGKVTGPKETTRTRPNTEVRLGAIYALEKLAREDLDMHWPIMETLCAYIRENGEKAPPPGAEIAAIISKHFVARSDEERKRLAAFEESLKPPTVDVQAALTVVGRRPRARRDYEAAQREAGGGDAWRLDLRGAALARADLGGLRLAGTRFERAALWFARADEAHLEGARLHEAHLEGASLREAHLGGARLDRAHLEGALVTEGHLEGASLREAHLGRASLDRAHLEGASLIEAQLQRASLDQAHLEGASLDDAHLEGASLVGAHLEGASLDRAHVERANLADASMNDASLEANLSQVRGLEQAQIASAWGTFRTRLPDGVARPTNERWLPEPDDFEAIERWVRNLFERREFWRAEAIKRNAGADDARCR